MILSLCGSLRFILRGASCFKVFSCSLSSCFFISFSIVITSLGAEGAGLCASRAFVCLFVLYVLVFYLVFILLVNFCHFSLPFGVRVWLRLVIVALPVLFY